MLKPPLVPREGFVLHLCAIPQVSDLAPSSVSRPFHARGRQPPPNQPFVRGGAAQLAVFISLAASCRWARRASAAPVRSLLRLLTQRHIFIAAMTVLAASRPLDVAPRPSASVPSAAPPRAAFARLRTSIVPPLHRSPRPGSRTLATRRSCGPSRLFAAPCGPPPGSLTTTVAWCDPRRCEARPAGLSDDRGRTTPKNHPCCCPPRGPSAQY